MYGLWDKRSDSRAAVQWGLEKEENFEMAWRVAECDTSCVASECDNKDKSSWLGAGPVKACCSKESARPYTSPDTPLPSTHFTWVPY